MKARLKATLLFLVFCGFTSSDSVRTAFHQAVDSEEKLAKIVDSPQSNDPLIMGYQGLANCVSANYAFWPSTKWSFFKTGKAKIEFAIKQNSTNPELRYIRLMVQLNAPDLVGYSDEVTSDMNFFIQHLSNYSIDRKWKVRFIDNLMKTEYISQIHLNQLKSLKHKVQ